MKLHILFALVIIVHAHGALAQDLSPQSERLANEIIGEVLSPFCPGRALSDCPSSKAGELKNEIRSHVAKGESKQAILAKLYEQFGEGIRAVPKSEGFGKAVWIGPAVFLILGAVLITVWMKRKLTAPATSRTSTAPLDPETERRIARELEQSQ